MIPVFAKSVLSAWQLFRDIINITHLSTELKSNLKNIAFFRKGDNFLKKKEKRLITLNDFLEECQKYFDALEKDFGRDAETEARCWYNDEIAADEVLMKSIAEKLAKMYN